MSSGLFDNPSGLHMPAVEALIRLRATVKTDPYNPATHVDDWSQPDQAELQGFISSSSSSRTTDRLDTTTESDAVLTCPAGGKSSASQPVTATRSPGGARHWKHG